MVGITSWGAYIPRYRLDRRAIFAAIGWFNATTASIAKGERAVANYDEDSVTMAVEAATACLKGFARDEVGGLYLSSTTLPYLERQNAGICATALALRPDIRTADFTASLKSGTSALISACDGVRSGDITNFLVCAADCRQGKPGSNLEHIFGDGATALLVGKDDVVAEYKGSYSLTYDFVDYHRAQEERFIHAWEERWIRDEGYGKIIPKAVAGLLTKYNLRIDDFAKVVISCSSTRELQGICKKLRVRPDRVQENMINNVGDSGSALALMMFISALEDAKVGDKILVVSYGSGSDALFFEATEQIEKARERMGRMGQMNLKKNLDNYLKYLVFRNLVPVEMGIRGEDIPLVRMSMTYREDRTLAALCGSKCKVCGTPQYPKQRVCINPECNAIDQMENYYFYDKVGRIKSFTSDNLAFSWHPPAMYGLIDFEGGGRLYLDITDCEFDSLKVGVPVKMSFRRKFIGRHGVYAYFWKAVPISEKGLQEGGR